MTSTELDRIFHHWPSVMRQAKDDWAKGFAASIARHARHRNWKPSPKQAALMRKLVADLFIHTDQEGDFSVIED